MSRPAQRNGATASKGRLADDGDICPVCKSSRYLNPNLTLLVNPECYHKMCESCVDRIFSQGPAPCPIAGCRRTLRKARFRKQTFGDIQIEREVDIRRRVSKIFNRREDDFDTLLDYNDYLNEVEDITFNLINGIDIEASERRLNDYVEANKQDISRNESLANQERRRRELQAAAEEEASRLRREAAAREDEEERRARAEGRRDIINKLASSDGNAESIARDGHRVMLKRSQMRTHSLQHSLRLKGDSSTANGSAAPASDAAAGDPPGGFQIKGLKKRVDPAPELPYDAFEGLTLERERFVLLDTYPVEWLEHFGRNAAALAGGYDAREYCARALCEAFAGFGVFVEEEVADRNQASEAPVATVGAAAKAAGKVVKSDISMDDVF